MAHLSALPRLGPVSLLPVLLTAAIVRLAMGPFWYQRAPVSDPIYGVDFSCGQAVWLGENCHQAYTAILDQLHVRHIRISAYWNQIERQPGVYDFSQLDWQIDEAAARGVAVTLTVGMKGQRSPEYYLPAWLLAGRTIPAGSSPAAYPAIVAATLAFVRATVAHEAGQTAIEAWQVENEPYVHFWHTAHDWSLPRWLVQAEAATIRASDPRHRPLLITHASWLSTDGTWRTVLKDGDILGMSVYTKRQRGPFARTYLYPFQIGPLTPNLPAMARAAARQGKALWITELQAEPFEAPSVDLRQHDCNLPSISPARLRGNLRLAARSGATRAYLWGAEWWYYCLTTRHDPRYWRLIEQVMRAPNAREPLPAPPAPRYGGAAMPPEDTGEHA